MNARDDVLSAFNNAANAMLGWVAIQTRLPCWVAPSRIGTFVGFAVVSVWLSGTEEVEPRDMRSVPSEVATMTSSFRAGGQHTGGARKRKTFKYGAAGHLYGRRENPGHVASRKATQCLAGLDGILDPSLRCHPREGIVDYVVFF